MATTPWVVAFPKRFSIIPGFPPTTTIFYYDGDSIIEERAQGAVTATYARPPHCFGAGQPKTQSCLTMRRAGKDYFLHTDDQGNALAVTTTGGAVVERYEYEDYGAVKFLTSDGIPTSATTSSIGNPFLFQGMERDAETGFYHDGSSDALDVTYKAKTGKSGSAKRTVSYTDPISGRSITRCDDGSCALADNNPWSVERTGQKMIPITVPDITGNERRVSINGSGAGSAIGIDETLGRTSTSGNGNSGVFMSRGTQRSQLGGDTDTEGSIVIAPLVYKATQGKTGKAKL